MNVFMIGGGDIARYHGMAVEKLYGNVIGVFDVNQEHAQKYAERFQCKAVAYPEIEEGIQKSDYVVISTPPTKRLDYVEMVLRAHKPLYMEKPIGTSMKDAEELKKLEEKHEGRILVGFAHQYRPPFRKLTELVKSGALGDPVNLICQRLGHTFGHHNQGMQASWRTDPKLACGMTIESLSHDFGLISSLAGPFASISANIGYTIDSLPNYDTNANITMKMKNGGIASINASWSSDLGQCTRGYVGTKGTAFIRGEGLFEFDELVYKTEEMEYPQKIIYNDSYDRGTDKVIFNVHKHFQECIQNNSPFVTDLDDGIEVLRLSLAALESSATQKTIIL